ncbi:MAG: hypothetical protein FWD27_04645 [Coriobacteriia bacterium]|nr:hypothetical protein [Coriobacteriia bacterium]
MNERKTSIETSAHGSAHDFCKCVACQLELEPTRTNLVDATACSSAGSFGAFRVSPVAKQALVEMARKAIIMDNAQNNNSSETPIQKSRGTAQPQKDAANGNRTKAAKMGRPASSSTVYLVPQFRDPLDIELLGKALISIAMKLPPPEEGAGERSDGRELGGKELSSQQPAGAKDALED